MLLPRVAGAGASAGKMLVAIGTSTGPASTGGVVVVVAVVAETMAEGATRPVTTSAIVPTNSARTRTLDFTVRRLLGCFGFCRGGQGD
jgi:hypothetical protein